MKRLAYLFLVSGLIISSCSQSPKLVWSDEFDVDGRPDSSNWSYQYGNGCPALCGWGNNEVEFYTDSTSNVRVENGLLIIEALRRDSIWTSARIRTKGKRNFKYGRIEFRAKLPEGTGTWPALWMLNERIDEIGWPKAGEIDIMEHVGRRPAVIQASLHTQSSFGKTVNTDSTTLETFSSDFHIYALEWTAGKLDVFVDDNKFYTYAPVDKNPDTWPFDSPYYILINLAMGGSFGGPVDQHLTKVRFEVDYVRVYQ